MGFWGFGKKKKQEQTESKDSGGFVGFVLLSEPFWSREQFIKDFKKDWDMDAAPSGDDEEDEAYRDILIVEQDGMRLTVSFMGTPVPNGEAEHYAAANYMWPDAVETTKKHQAQILVAVLGEEAGLLERGKLFTKAVASCLSQEHAVAVYTDGAVFQPEFYRNFAMMMQDGALPVMDWVWFGIYRDKKQSGIYTYGMKKFGMDEIEVYTDISRADLNEIREFMLGIVAYILESDVTLHDGETIGFSEGQKLPITRSRGIALEGQTLKIKYGE